MAMNETYAASEPTREDVDNLKGATVLEFGSPYCGHCLALQPTLSSVFAAHPNVRHLKIADASGRPLGRSFRVKLWPTLIFLDDGREVSRLVRVRDSNELQRAFELIDKAH